ncbi:hypothetical protein THAOC_17876 [Thalassiosira oceanica]|uniref:Uncharacterized protein n=1 Tax=Thalassiosira oceanica TaxID=159749 RepID=K0SKY2_THAOC|nr:hypothetical protein THAOC_17876 [Thalassiosira oceanica]|eukprot:EJK61606.1 hypothetical protein THAOC_17876 [Thalassiosira oceanica]
MQSLTWNELPQEQHLRAGPVSVGCVDGHRFNDGADWPSGRLLILKRLDLLFPSGGLEGRLIVRSIETLIPEAEGQVPTSKPNQTKPNQTKHLTISKFQAGAGGNARGKRETRRRKNLSSCPATPPGAQPPPPGSHSSSGGRGIEQGRGPLVQPEGLGQYPTSGGVSMRAVDDRGWAGPKGSKGGMGGGVRKEYGVLSPASPKTPSSLPTGINPPTTVQSEA